MKNAMKKIMGLLLVAVLLVSAVPFQALAAEGDYTVHVWVKDTNDKKIADSVYPEEAGQNSTVGRYLRNMAKNFAEVDADAFNRATITIGGKNNPIGLDDEVTQSSDLYIVLNAAEPKPTDPPAAETPAAEDYTVKVTVKDAKKDLATGTYTEVAGQNSTVARYLRNMAKNNGINLDNYTVEKYWVKNGDTGSDGKYVDEDYAVTKSSSVVIKLAEKEAAKPTEPKPTEPAAEAIKVVVKVNTSDNVVKTFEKVPANGKSAKVGDLLTYGWSKDWDNVYEFDHAWNHTTQEEVTKSQSVKAGETLYIMLKNANGGSSSGNGSSSNKFPYKVYLHVYLNNNIGEPDRNINITNTLATDGVVSMSEVKNLIPTYYSAKNSDGIGYDGLYLAKGNWVKDYVTDSNKVDKLKDVDVRTGEEYVHINVMITNAKAKSSSTADSSNPKTGDAIFMTITVMGLSAAALTGMYFYDKKRKVL